MNFFLFPLDKWHEACPGDFSKKNFKKTIDKLKLIVYNIDVR